MLASPALSTLAPFLSLYFSSGLGTEEYSLCKTGLMTDGKFGYCTVWLVFLVMPYIFVKRNNSPANGFVALSILSEKQTPFVETDFVTRRSPY
jgi:hypothetical protein